MLACRILTAGASELPRLPTVRSRHFGQVKYEHSKPSSLQNQSWCWDPLNMVAVHPLETESWLRLKKSELQTVLLFADYCCSALPNIGKPHAVDNARSLVLVSMFCKTTLTLRSPSGSLTMPQATKMISNPSVNPASLNPRLKLPIISSESAALLPKRLRWNHSSKGAILSKHAPAR